MNKRRSSLILKIIIYVVSVFLAVLSIAPFYIMVINATRLRHRYSSMRSPFFPLLI